jgi:predicted 3-demethylubiquinone-9 3-methyltransferase (glyoxalase superfamily)
MPHIAGRGMPGGRNPSLAFTNHTGGEKAMPEQIATFNLSLSGTKEHREDRWAIWSNEFSFFVYGETEEEVEDMYHGAVQALFDSFHQDLQGIEGWLNEKGVRYQIITIERPLGPVLEPPVPEPKAAFSSRLRLELANAAT